MSALDPARRRCCQPERGPSRHFLKRLGWSNLAIEEVRIRSCFVESDVELNCFPETLRDAKEPPNGNSQILF